MCLAYAEKNKIIGYESSNNWNRQVNMVMNGILNSDDCGDLQGGAPPVISWFIIPITMDITTINPSYSTYKPT